MDTPRRSQIYKLEEYDIEIVPITDRRLSISISDSLRKAEYFEKDLVLENIVVNTLGKALERSIKDIRIHFQPKNTEEISLIEVRVTVESTFLKGVEEIFYLKKVRDISQAETVMKSIDYLSKRIKEIKQAQQDRLQCYYGATLETKSYNGAGYQTIGTIRLPRGKYLLTLSFLMKATNQWGYIYFNQGQTIIANCGFYVPSTTYFMPHTLRKVHNILGDNENVSFTTYCANSYPVSFKNVIIVARPLKE